jgi:hypothetical protein
MGEYPESQGGRAYGVPAKRARIIKLLTEAYAADDLDEAEFERRVERAESARTIEDLDALIADFPPDVIAAAGAPAPGGATLPVRLSREEVDREVARLDELPARTKFSLLGDNTIALHPEDPPVAQAMSLIGDSTVDLRELAGRSGVVLVKVAAAIGDTRIVVPRGTPVDLRLIGLIGDQQRMSRRRGNLLGKLARKLGIVEDRAEPNVLKPGPTVVVTGFHIIGDTIVVEE